MRVAYFIYKVMINTKYKPIIIFRFSCHKVRPYLFFYQKVDKLWTPSQTFSTLLKLNLFGWVVVDDW